MPKDGRPGRARNRPSGRLTGTAGYPPPLRSDKEPSPRLCGLSAEDIDPCGVTGSWGGLPGAGISQGLRSGGTGGAL